MSRPLPSRRPTRGPVISMVSLGCAKNTVDSECLLGNLAGAGLVLAEDPADSDICLVNTCGFIEAAREETAATLRELDKLKRRGQVRAIVALGCMVERAAKDPLLASVLDRADARVTFAEYPRLPEICRALHRQDTPRLAVKPTVRTDAGCGAEFLDFLASPRARMGPVHSACLKIAEGCSNRCAYCAIPAIRGPQVSRPPDDILREAGQLVRHGAREINLIAQDTARYGHDLPGRPRLADLLRALGRDWPETWFRLLYAHPRHLDDEVIRLVAGEPYLCPYLDVPLQHIADPILQSMGRGITKSETLALLEKIRQWMPDGALRTTFIVGYPGETRAQFEELLTLVREGWFTHVGAFTYSREPGIPAADLPDTIPSGEKQQRLEELMLTQQDMVRRRLQRHLGRETDVLVDRLGREIPDAPEGIAAAGRTRLQAPEVDGRVLLRGPLPASLCEGDLLRVRLTEALDYDWLATPAG